MNEYLYGDWDKAIKRIKDWEQKLPHSLETALKQEAQELRTAIIQGIDAGGAPGANWPPRSDTTRATMEALGQGNKNKTLIRHGDLRNSITVVSQGQGSGSSAFIGVLRAAVGKAGKSLYNIADIHEHGRGPFAVSWSAKARAYLMALWRQAGFEPDPTKRGPHVGDTVLIRIPARPFLRPVFKALFGDKEAARQRFMGRVVKLLKSGK